MPTPEWPRMMEFEGKDRMLQKIAANASMERQLLRYMGLARELAGKSNQMLAQAIEEDLQRYMGKTAGRKERVSPDRESRRILAARGAAAGAAEPEENL